MAILEWSGRFLRFFRNLWRVVKPPRCRDIVFRPRPAFSASESADLYTIDTTEVEIMLCRIMPAAHDGFVRAMGCIDEELPRSDLPAEHAVTQFDDCSACTVDATVIYVAQRGRWNKLPSFWFLHIHPSVSSP